MPSKDRAPADPPAEPAASATDERVARPDPPEVLAAVSRVQQGDSAAFEIIHRTFGPGLKQFFLNRRLPEEVAQELYQEALLRAWRQIHQFRFDGPFAAWLQRIGENLWKNDRRARQTQKRNMVLLSLEADPDAGNRPIDEPLFGEPPPSPEAQAVRAELTGRVARALRLLAPGQRRCVELRYGQDLKYREVAEVLGVSVGAVQSQVHEGKNRLRLLLRDEGGSGDDGR
jgi:RNA polymerase sigma-70 factor, ECF subfamily